MDYFTACLENDKVAVTKILEGAQFGHRYIETFKDPIFQSYQDGTISEVPGPLTADGNIVIIHTTKP